LLSGKVDCLEDVILKKIRASTDPRGLFLKFHPAQELKNPLDSVVVSYNPEIGTLRGLHFQLAPSTEEKLITCIQGSIYEVAVDLRPKSLTFAKWMAFELSADSQIQVYLPKGVAHGFQTLSESTILHYSISVPFSPENSIAINPLGNLNIPWPLNVTNISERDVNGVTFEIAANLFSNSLSAEDI
jgi:dTDP-4-dehydrorhamnose 3,5-epimerase